MFATKIEGSTQDMTNVDKLITYILTLTPEQADKVIRQLPRLTELLAESLQPCLQEQSLRTQSA